MPAASGVLGLLAALDRAGADVTEREAADALWLAAHMTSTPAAAPSAADRPTADAVAGTLPVRATASPAGDGTEDTPGDRGQVLTIWSASRGTQQAAPPRPHSRGRQPSRPLELLRALRALARTTHSGHTLVLDEEATATQSADAETVMPVLVPSPRRWLSLALVIDSGPSMILWEDVAAELHALLAQLGAFRAIRAWDLQFRDGTAVICPHTSAGTPRSPRELVDPTGRQAILVLTDCTGDPWRDGDAMRILHDWARTGPLAIVQPLPQRMWERSALASHYVQLRAPRPGAPNYRLDVTPADPYLAADDVAGIPVPVLGITPSWFAAWARLVAGPGRAYAMTAFTKAVPVAGDASDAADEPDDAADDDRPEQIVGRFRAGASPGAFRLAGHLAAAPLSLPMMRYLQAELTDPDPQQLAEVYLGGLLCSRPAPAPAEPAFDFLPGVREELLRTITRSDAARVLELVAAGPGRLASLGQPGGTAAAAGDIGDADAGIESMVLRRIGRYYALGAGLDPSMVVIPADPNVSVAAAPPATGEVPPESRPVVPAVPPTLPPAVSRPTVGIAMWGPPLSGKTTFLAALSIALARQSTSGWRLVGIDEPSTDALISLTTDLARRQFPNATAALDQYSWVMERPLKGQPPRRRLRPGRLREQVPTVGLDLADASGELFSLASRRYPEAENDLMKNLENSRGIVYVFDPVREFSHGDIFEHTIGVLNRLASRMTGSDALVNGR
ncbi:MAG TPA: SAV_2336 N-terminal domain-related protein, partial [Streptosporangiaceae bacterium]|nr:SAV_2336 N-terminal domain-related protein [Streptosporangiaceae bacterium]